MNNNESLTLHLKPEQKARLIRAATLRQTNLTHFVLEVALREADTVIAQAEQLQLSQRDSLRVLDLLENPPLPNAKLRAAAAAARTRI